jgi:lysozyme
MNLDLLKKELIIDEGMRRNPYRDTKGIMTVGIGFNLEAHKLPNGITFPLSDKDVETLYKISVDEVISGMDSYIPWWKGLDEVRQRVIANMVFNMGIGSVLKFKNTLFFIKKGDYYNAARNMRKSKWYKQVHDRAERLCVAMKTGKMPHG